MTLKNTKQEPGGQLYDSNGSRYVQSLSEIHAIMTPESSCREQTVAAVGAETVSYIGDVYEGGPLLGGSMRR